MFMFLTVNYVYLHPNYYKNELVSVCLSEFQLQNTNEPISMKFTQIFLI